MVCATLHFRACKSKRIAKGLPCLCNQTSNSTLVGIFQEDEACVSAPQEGASKLAEPTESLKQIGVTTMQAHL